MDHLREVLEKCVSRTCQDTLNIRSALYYEALVGITVDNVTTLVFNLTGTIGNSTSQMVAWTRRPHGESQLLRVTMEQALSDLCWDKVADVSSIWVEGTVSIVIDNAEILFLQLDKISFSPTKKEDAATIEDLPESAPQEGSTSNETQDVGEPVSDTNHDEPQVISILENPVNSEIPLSIVTDVSELVPPEGTAPQTVASLLDDPATSMDTEMEAPNLNEQEEVLVVMVPDEVDHGIISKKIQLPTGEFLEENEDWQTEIGSNALEQEEEYEEIPQSDGGAMMLSQLALTTDMTQVVQPKKEVLDEKQSSNRSTVLICGFCGLAFRTTAKLNQHMEKHSLVPIVDGNTGTSNVGSTSMSTRCQYCGREFTTHKSLQNHCCRHQCELCDFVAANKILLKSHVIRQHETPHRDESQPLTCTVCQKHFKTYQRFREHKQFHKVDSLSNMALRKLLDMDGQRLKGAVSCILCDRTFEFSYHIKTHMKKVHLTKGHLDAFNIIRQCPELVLTPVKLRKLLCGSVKSLSSLALSLLAKPCTKTGSEFNCLLCKRRRLTQFHVIRHLEQHLKTLIEGQSGTLRLCVQRNYPCYQCYRKFKSEQTLLVHIVKEHSDEKKVKSEIKLECEICGRMFKNTANINRHMDMHRIRDVSGKKWKTAVPFQCKQCSKCYATEEKLRAHIEGYHDNVESNVEDLMQKTKLTEMKRMRGEVKIETNIGMRTRSGIRINKTSDRESKVENKVKVENDNIEENGKKRKREKEICADCGMILTTRSGLRMHQVRWHGAEPVNKKAKWLQKTTPQKAMCEDCGKVLMSRGSIPRHRKICPRNRERSVAKS